MMRRYRKQFRGVTLFEILLAASLMTVLATAVTYCFVAGLDMQRVHNQRQATENQTASMEEHITRMLQGAKLTGVVTDTTTYFIATAANNGNVTDLGCDRLTFTTIAPDVPQSSQHSQDDFETQQQAVGPVGGTAEVSWSTNAIGDAGNKTGLFERLQRPSDGDPSQGGMESLLSPDVDRIGFEFWNGTQWVETWDSVNGDRRLPAEVRINYVQKGDATATVRTILVPIPASDVTAQNPSTNGQ